jgi:hypothetical protein
MTDEKPREALWVAAEKLPGCLADGRRHIAQFCFAATRS